jgi:predicted dehydrogenase
MKEIRLGTIGSGMIVHAILDNVMKTHGIRLEAVYSRSPEKAAAVAERYGCEKTYTDMDAFLQDGAVDFVYIASPNLLHYPQAKQALLAGKNVILEKPFCTKAAHARELVDLAHERGLILIDAVPTSFLPNLAFLRQALPKVGRIRLVQSNYSQYSSRYDQLLQGQVTNIFDPQFAGGCLMDINFYNTWLNVALFGKPDKAEYLPNIYPGLADTSGVLNLVYGDFISTNSGAKDTWGINYFQIEGEKGFIYAQDGSNALSSIRVVTKNSDETFNIQHNPDRWSYEVEGWVRMICSDARDEMARRLEITLQVMETMESARLSAGIRFPGDA